MSTEFYPLNIHNFTSQRRGSKSPNVLCHFCTYVVSERLLHSGGHHDDADGGDQQEVEGVHDAGPRGLFDLGAAATAA